MRLHELVQTRYNMSELAGLLLGDKYTRESLLYKDNLTAFIQILQTAEGQAEWDEFIARKRKGSHPGRKVINKRKEKIQQSFKVFKRISDVDATDEVINEFVIETERKASEQSIVKLVEPGSGSSHSPEVSI